MADFQSLGNFPSLIEAFINFVIGSIKVSVCLFISMASSPKTSLDLEFLREFTIVFTTDSETSVREKTG